MLLLVAVGLILVALAVAWFAFRQRPRGPGQRDATDPLATAGMGIAVAGAATIPTLGPIMVLMTLIGIVLMVIANRRSPHDRRL
jgi:ABC-type Co2+ transport system permease subunit